jgi:type IV pilus assembly protein PilO
MADNPLMKLPVAGQLGVAVGTGLAIGAAFYFFLYQGMVEERTKKSADLDALQKTIRELEITVAKLPEFEKEVKALEDKLELLKRFLPPERETPDLIRKVHRLATESTLSVKKFNPKTPVNKDFYQEYPIDVELEGTYHNLGIFFDKVGRLPRLVNAGNIAIKVATTPRINNTISTTFTATTYVYVEKPPTPAAAPGAPGGVRR